MSRYARKVLTMCEFGRLAAGLGTDPRISVGAVVFPTDCSAVLGLGYNGAAAGLPHDSIALGGQIGSGASGAAHAEANALLKAGRIREPALLFTTLMPCPFCAPLVVNSGVVGVVFAGALGDQRSGEGVLRASGMPVVPAWAVAAVAGSGGWPEPSGVADRDGALRDAEDALSWWATTRPVRPRMPETGGRSS